VRAKKWVWSKKVGKSPILQKKVGRKKFKLSFKSFKESFNFLNFPLNFWVIFDDFSMILEALVKNPLFFIN
jgi:hypothetical protein